MIEQQEQYLENNMSSEIVDEIPVLPKHVYPKWVITLWVFIMLFFLSFGAYFVVYELPHHRTLGENIKTAEKYFLDKEYNKALNTYIEIVEQHPTFKKGNIRIAQSIWAVCSHDEKYYSDAMQMSLTYLKEVGFSFSEFEQVCSFIPLACREDFRSCFEFTRKKRR